MLDYKSIQTKTRMENPELNGYTQKNVYTIKVENLYPDKDQKEYESDLRMELYDFIYQPLVVHRDEKGLFKIVSGSLLYHVAELTGLDELACVITDGDTDEIIILVNLIKDTYTAVDQAEAIQKLVQKYGYTENQIDEILGGGDPSISEILSINKLPKELLDECRGRSDCARSLLIDAAKQETRPEMMRYYRKYKDSDKYEPEYWHPHVLEIMSLRSNAVPLMGKLMSINKENDELLLSKIIDELFPVLKVLDEEIRHILMRF